MRKLYQIVGFMLSACAGGELAHPAGAPLTKELEPSSGGYTFPAVASLSDGVWMKGDLHIHSRHSTDSSNNPVAKILALGKRAGMDYLLSGKMVGLSNPIYFNFDPNL